jgi:hypothetical protein
MRNSLLVVIAYLLMGSLPCLAQSPPPPPPPAARPVRVVGKAEVFYFKNSDISRVNVGSTLLGSHETMLREDFFSIAASFSVHGPKVTRPKVVNLELYSYTHGSTYRYKNDNQVTIFVNNKALVWGPAHESFLSIDPRGGVTEYYSVSMSYENFLKMTKASVVSLQMGKTRFDLKRENIDALGDLNRAIE